MFAVFFLKKKQTNKQTRFEAKRSSNCAFIYLVRRFAAEQRINKIMKWFIACKFIALKHKSFQWFVAN